jgi:hypothetical protein
MIGEVPYASAATKAKKKPTATRGLNAGSFNLLEAAGSEERWVTSDPATMRTAPAACSIVHGSWRMATAKTSVTTELSWITGAVRFTPAAWLARKLQYRPSTKWKTPAAESVANAEVLKRFKLWSAPVSSATARKHARPTGMLMIIPCAGVPLMTPRLPVALVKANVAPERMASTAPRRCTAPSRLLINQRSDTIRPNQ